MTSQHALDPACTQPKQISRHITSYSRIAASSIMTSQHSLDPACTQPKSISRHITPYIGIAASSIMASHYAFDPAWGQAKSIFRHIMSCIGISTSSMMTSQHAFGCSLHTINHHRHVQFQTRIRVETSLYEIVDGNHAANDKRSVQKLFSSLWCELTVYLSVWFSLVKGKSAEHVRIVCLVWVKAFTF